MTYRELIDAATSLFNTGNIASPTDAADLRAIIDRLLDPSRGGSADASDPANSGIDTTL